MARLSHGLSPLLLGLAVLSACDSSAPCARCDTIVIAATSEPAAIFPPLAGETVGRDIGDQVFERLADLPAGRAPIDTAAYVPRLAARWERLDSLSWRFHLRPGARWHDGKPVTAADVQFSFAAAQDSVIDSPARSNLTRIAGVTADDPATVTVRFSSMYPEQLYDAIYHVRIIPKHLWDSLPMKDWAADTSLARLVGSGPYRVLRWDRGQSLTLEAVMATARPARIKRAVWRFASDPDAALNLVLSHEADLLEAVGTPDRAARVAGDTALTPVKYASANYGFLGYQLATDAKRHTPLLEREVRRALSLVVDRTELAHALFGPDAKAPPGPMSQLLWIWNDSISVLPHQPDSAARLLDRAGWRLGRDGVRRRGRVALAFDILVPSSSSARRRLAEALQETWRGSGARVTVTAVDFPVFQQRLRQGQFDSYVGAWLDEPSPRGLAGQWTRSGWGDLNFGKYANPAFDSLFARAVATPGVKAARALWREAMDTLNADAPALFLFAPTNVAAVSRRVVGVTIDPYSWLSGLPEWSLDPAHSRAH